MAAAAEAAEVISLLPVPLVVLLVGMGGSHGCGCRVLGSWYSAKRRVIRTRGMVGNESSVIEKVKRDGKVDTGDAVYFCASYPPGFPGS
jgi:hypothetical protein